MHRVIVVGSPRATGRSALLADELFNACIEECPEDGVSIVSVASTQVNPCVGCDACRAEADEPLFTFEEGDPLIPCDTVLESDAVWHHCVIDDDMAEVRKHLDAADELIMVAPVYFASAPAQLKALLDRLQPYYWSDVRQLPKRPATIHVVGEGGDPHGFEPLIGTVRSALSVAGFQVQRVLDWVGKITPEGEIVAEADEYEVAYEEEAGIEGFEDEDVAELGYERAFASEFGDDEGERVSEFATEPEFESDFDFEPEFGLDFEPASEPTCAAAPVKLSLSQAPKGAGKSGSGAPKGSKASRGSKGSSGSGSSKGSQGSKGTKKQAARGSAPRKSSGKGGPAYGRKNTKKKGNGRGGHR